MYNFPVSGFNLPLLNAFRLPSLSSLQICSTKLFRLVLFILLVLVRLVLFIPSFSVSVILQPGELGALVSVPLNPRNGETVGRSTSYMFFANLDPLRVCFTVTTPALVSSFM